MDPQSHTQSYTWAKCPELKCGTTKRLISNIPSLRIRDENERNKRNEYLRIVGGDRSTPHSWPYIVALYKNGHFHCGGTILSSRWVNANIKLLILNELYTKMLKFTLTQVDHFGSTLCNKS